MDAEGVAWRGVISWRFEAPEDIVIGEPSPWIDVPLRQVMVGARYSPLTNGTNLGTTAICGLARDGDAVWCNGPNDYGQRGLGRVDPYGSEPVSPTQVVGLPGGVEEIAVGLSHVCARAGGEVWCWGLGEWGQLGYAAPESCAVPGTTDPWACSSSPALAASISGAVRVAAGIQYTCVETADDVLCFGQNHLARLGRPGPSGMAPISPLF